MDIKFTVYAWRDIMRICGTITATCAKEMIVCKYIGLHFDSDQCTAYGSNGSQISKISVPCKCHDVPWQYRLMIQPMKIPSGTKAVELQIDDEKKEFTVVYLDAEDDILDAVTYQFFDGDWMDYEQFYKKAHNNIDQFNGGEGMYCICVNPKFLLNALEGFKSCDRIILNFAGRVDPFTIRPYDDDTQAEALVYPVRIL